MAFGASNSPSEGAAERGAGGLRVVHPVGLLFTDIEGSTRLARELGPELWPRTLSDHHSILSEAIANEGGTVENIDGDAFVAIFPDAQAAVAAAVAAQRRLIRHRWEQGVGTLKVRMGVHAGVVEPRGRGYVGLDLHLGARVAAAANGGQILLSAAARRAVGGTVTVRDLGEHRLKDFPEPERLFHVVLDSGPVPLPRTASVRPTNLPPRARPLLGRDRELRELYGLLTRGADPLVTLTGIGGSGKTRLAVAVGSELLDWASGGVFVVRLAATKDPGSVLPMIAEAVGIAGESELSLPGALARRLGEQPTVLILDNFEQLVPAASLVADLASEAAELRVLVTSQVPLRLSIERVFALGPLDREDAVALFLERARAHDREFEPTAEGRAAIERICALLDDTPLAIELAAARLQSLDPVALAERLAQPLSVLTRGDRDRPERQRSLRATIDWSFGLLAPGQRELFVRLGVFAGAVPLTAVVAVEGVDGAEGDMGVLDELEALVESSLVRRRTEGRLGTRFLMPQALRDYAGERLRDSGEEAWVRRRHAEHVGTIVHAGRLWKWGAAARQRADLEALAQEIRPAVAWARSHDPALHVRLCATAGLYWIYQGVISEAEDELRTAVDSGEGSPAERAWVMTLLAKCLQLTGTGSDAVAPAEQALTAWRAVTDDTERAIGLGVVSWVYRWLLRRRESIELAEESLELLRATPDRELTLRGLVFLIHALVDDGQLDRAESLLEDAAVISAGDHVHELDPIRGDIADLRGHDAQAARYYARSLAWSSEAGEAHQTLMDLRALVISLSKAGHSEAALEAAELIHLQEAGTGRVGEHPEWRRALEQAVELARQTAGHAAVQAARARAQALPAGQATQRALALAEITVGTPRKGSG
jgi:predicted ATPase/class 3 adenylate cyclase